MLEKPGLFGRPLEDLPSAGGLFRSDAEAGHLFF